MNKRTSGLGKVIAALSLAGGILAAAAAPAFAASPNEAYGAFASGLVNIGKVARATYPGTSPVTVASITGNSLISAGVVTDRANATSASSTVANASVTLLPLVALTATEIQSSCRLNTDTGRVTGASTLTGASIAGVGALAVHPAPNTGVSVTGVTTVTLNRQRTAGDGTLTVDAVYVKLLNGQTLTIGTSKCNAASLAPVPALPGIALPIGLGVAGLLGLGGVAYYFSRRRPLVTAA